jgi:hypothetical protein
VQVFNDTGFEVAMKNQVDLRKYPRFLATFGAVAELTESKLGKISNISRGGLAFSYIDFEDEDDLTARISSEVNIFHEPGFSLLDVPCKVMKDAYSPPDNEGFFKMNKCRIQFHRLTPYQEVLLYFFLQNFTICSSRETY